jgi:drug/metabolite transporter (DMT)-like permease
MVTLLLGIAAAAAASTFYSLGIAVQALDAKQAEAQHQLRLSLLGHLFRQIRWLLGTGLTTLGWPLQIGALMLAPFVVVQPALAAGLLVLLAVGERMLGERPGRREVLAVCAIIVGVAGIAAVAPERSTAHKGTTELIVVLAGLGVAALLPFMLRFLDRQAPLVTMLGAGLGFAWSGLVTKFVADAASNGHWLTALAWAISTGIASGLAVISEMTALQTRPAIQVAPVVFVVQTLVPVALAPLLLHENYFRDPLAGAVLLISLGVLLSGAAVLASSPALIALMAPEADGAQASVESGTAESRACDSDAAKPAKDASDASDPSSVTTTTSPARSGR